MVSDVSEKKDHSSNDHAKRGIISLVNVTKDFPLEKGKSVQILRGINININEGDFAILYGPSGSGKSTILNIILGLDSPTSGSVHLFNHAIGRMSEDERAQLRAKRIGVVYQQSNWVKALSVIENVALPLLIDGGRYKNALERAKTALNGVGMGSYADHRPTQLSGGQQQLVSLARALVNNPEILILDEPTGNLDTVNAQKMIDLLTELNHTRHAKTVVMVTHNFAYISRANEAFSVRDGQIDKMSDSKSILKETLLEAKIAKHVLAESGSNRKSQEK